MAGHGGGGCCPWRGVRISIAVMVVLSLAASTYAQAQSPDWTDWGELGPCSRTCGVGVAYRERTCLRTTNDGSPACVGPNKHYSTCNTQDCPHGSQSFRLQQCEHYNNISFDGEYYEWLPHYAAANPCELNCLAKGETFYYRHAAKVIDGTPCDLNTRDICIDGVCQDVGCDLVLGSELTVDKCGECGGDGSSCRTHGGFLDTDHLKSGYNDLILIPAGAMSISFEETRPGNNYLALRDLSGRFVLNGDWQIEAGHSLEVAGTTFTYSRGAHPSDQAEKLTANGPTKHPLFFSMLKQPGASPQVSYEYSLPLSVQTGAGHTYSWVPSSWAACSTSCGQGQQARTIQCRRSSDDEVVSESLCGPHGQPPKTQSCTSKPCPASWHIGYWEKCSATCGGGARARSVFCQRVEKGDLFSIVSDDQCQGPKPAAISHCNDHVQCPKWQVGKWSKCNRVCGLGQQTRTVYCLAQHPLQDAASDILPSGRCDPTDQPISARECNEGPCDGLEWVVSSWSGCLGECGHMMETRRVVCSSKVGEVFNDSMCDVTKRPGTTRPCPADTDCNGQTQWHASQWSQCSAMCGPGVQTRAVTCVQVHDDLFKKMDEDQCDPAVRMHDTRNCTGENCWGIWFSGPFGKCSKECGSGKMKREVLCFYGDQVATVDDCDDAIRPPTEEPCNMELCEDENAVGGCKSTDFGCCPDGETPAEGPDYFGCQAKDRIPTGSCVESEYGCCLDGITPAQGPFNAGCPYFTCKDLSYGCCPDGQTPAGGPDGQGCPEQFGCAVTAYGCCPDGVTASNGFNNEGCEAPVKTCVETPHGCCPDGVTEAAGPEQAGCDSLESSGQVCEESAFGCCPDGITAASGPHQEGCNEISSTCGFSLYGCCPDGSTAAEGPNSLGCPGVIVPPVIAPCSTTAYGCCPDGETAALGEDGYGCSRIELDCALSQYGCCPDGVSMALGADNDGCPAACLSSDYGCCPDGFTHATGPNEEGCHRPILVGGCAGTRHGCCPDNKTYAHGPYYQGCNVTKLVTECDMTSYGCCMDGETVAAGPDLMGCPEEGTYQRTCRDSPYGCCLDGISPADGPSYTGCPSLVDRGASCGLTSDTGSCSNFTVKWYYDPLMGDCTRFWYGGCEGNDNRFDNREDCQATCVKPEGIMSCYLPKSVGRCRASVENWYYNPENRECESFMYGGCLGNDNRFENHKDCEDKCIIPQSPDVCSQPHLPGPCRGNFARWFYDKTTGHCRQFIYGGCMGNDNRFETEELCEQRCQQSATKVCQLAVDSGPCRGAFHKFYFDAEARQCREFIYGGCHGNSNRFTSLPECQSFCHELVQKVVDVCMLPQDTGPCKAYMQRWHFDPTDSYCKQFVYGGCEGNDNRFDTEEQCRSTCNAKIPVDVCALDVDSGPCEAYSEQFAYDRHSGQCTKFVYGGCEGNANRFSTIEECKKICPDSKDQEHVTDTPPALDVCQLAKDAGPCYAYQTKFYYDSQEGECMSFTYGGCQGNENNFATLEECQNRCSSGRPKEEIATETPAEPPYPAYPDPRRPSQRVAPSNRTLSRRSAATSVCNEPLKPGSCADRLSRYYYDSESQRCSTFIYSGCQGNGNNFHSRRDCEKQCPSHISAVCSLPAEKGPCKASRSRYYFDADHDTCRPFTYGGCLGNGNRFHTVEECQLWCIGSVKDICALPQEAGPCSGYAVRYAYSATYGQCVSFVYGGCGGNANNFETQEACKTRCSSGGIHYVPGITDICAQKQDAGPCYEWESRYSYNTTSGRCEHFFYGGCEGNGNNFASQDECGYYCAKQTTTVPMTTTTRTEITPQRPVVTDICLLEKDPGPCYAHVNKFHYDAQQGICTEFVYGGCLGNHNNFESIEECEAYCGDRSPATKPPTTTDVCTQPRDPGPCYASMRRFYYDPTDGHCLEFVFGGCDGNDNNFATAEECSSRCGGRAPTTPISGDRCQQPKDSGVCLAYLPRYYYDATSGTCKQFIYGGCQGNRNRFMSEEDCREACTVRQTTIITQSPTLETTRPAATETPVELCEQSMEHGPCQEYIPSWYYNSTTDECVLFIYGGCEGNENRFSMKSVCERNCAREDICQLPSDEGECRGYQPSWYYDSRLGRCQAFVWGGCGGNANRFETMESCQARCGPAPTEKPTDEPTDEPITGLAVCGMRSEVGPCRESVSRWYFDYEDGMCKQFVYGGCRGNENNFDTKDACHMACPLTDICQLPSETGLCRAAKRRYFFNHHSGECELFTYGGCQGNANRFLQKENCESVCKEGPVVVMPPGEETDVCTLSMDPGPCAAYTRYWFYSIDENLCRQFTYGGCLGNGNRFDTEPECLQRCQREGVEVKPTTPRTEHTHTPARRTEPPSVVRTDPPQRETTPTSRTYTDVPVAGGVCSVAKDPGPCTDYTPVWYFEFNSRTCRRFLFGGCEGNGNRFDSRMDCESACLNTETTTIMTTTTSAWHHHTTPMTTTTESSIEYDLCSLDSDAGPCRDNITVQWYYNDDAQECQRFLYGGCQGNANRFAAQKECEKICILRQKKGICQKPADKGPCNDTQQRWHFDLSTRSCQQFIYGGCEGNGNRFKTESECRQVCGRGDPTTAATRPTVPPTDPTETRPVTRIDRAEAKDVCMLPMEQGPCSAGVQKWHYDYETARCHEFTYGGCLGNANQFDSLELCQAECGGTIVSTLPPTESLDVCQQPEHPGPCFADYLRFFYDGSTEECRPFIYGGCQANDNNFETQEDCYNRCGDNTKEHIIRKPGDCYLAPDAGPCRAAEKRYHFDPAQGDCIAFYYGGCEGNGNNFGEYRDCIAMCSKATVSCGVLSCDLQCPGEYARGPDGCLQCRCQDLCEGYTCDEGYECEVQQIQCFVAPCPPAQAACVPKQKEGECPELDVLRMGSCDRPCERDVDCAGAEKCCSSSCGLQCAAPAGPASMLPQCPPMEGELSTTTVKLCSQDADCPHGGKCCTNAGAGQVCLGAEQIPGCAGSAFGCCPDSITPATGYNFQGCPEEEPVVYDPSEEDRRVPLRGSIVLTCLSHGSPRPQITWYKDGFPVLADDTGRYAELEDDSLEIRQADDSDTAIFTCRAYNGVGSSATKAYSVTVDEPVSFGEMQSVVTVNHGTTAALGCVALGRPTPSVTWLRAGSAIFLDGTRALQMPNNSLVIHEVTAEDEGDYICEASNGVGAPNQRIIVLNVIGAEPAPGPLSVIMSAHNETHYVGGDVRLLCIVTGDGDIRTSWAKDGVPVVYDDRVKITPEAELFIEDVVAEDAGTYRCTATRGTESVSVESEIKVAGLRLPENCTDKPWLANCVLIVQARLCRHVYFSDFCCQSCHESGQLP